MTPDSIVLSIGGDPGAALAVTGQALSSLGYTVEPGPDGWSGAAEVGSAAMRAMVGGFARRMKVTYSLTQGHAAGAWVVTVSPAMSGMSGGAIGVSKARKEMTQISDTLRAALSQSGHLVGYA